MKQILATRMGECTSVVGTADETNVATIMAATHRTTPWNNLLPRLTQRRIALLILIPLCLVVFTKKSWLSSSSSSGLEAVTISIRQGLLSTNAEVNDIRDGAHSLHPFSDFVMDGNIPFVDRSPLPPLEMLQTYISQHSEQSLLRDWHSNLTDHRRFAIVHYSCPQQLGNRLHHFYNDFLLAFLTNRTILWRYWDREACIQLGNKYDHEICVDQNRSLSIDNPAQACDGLLQTAPWIPRYDDWAKRLNLPDPVQVWIRPINPHNAPHPTPEGVERIRWVDEVTDGQNSDQAHIGVSPDWKIAVFQPLVGVLGPAFVKNQLTKNSDWQSRVESLFHYGEEFWYGALFDHAFDLNPEFLKSVRPSTSLESITDPTLSTLSIALHSRHTDPADNGANVTNELKCLQSSLREMVALNLTSCRMFMLSDRPETLKTIHDHFRHASVNCTLVQAQHDDGGDAEIGLEAEHGPFAGAGFLRDLVLASRGASQSLHATWIGHARSSSKLLLEWLTYQRMIRFWKDYGVHPSRLPNLSRCQLPG